MRYLLSIMLLWSAPAFAQNMDAATVKRIVEGKNYVVQAQMVTSRYGPPTPGRSLTSDYDFTVTPDSIISYLPYFGRAYTAPTNPANSGIMFTSTQYDYTAKKSKKGWEITIRPKDNRDIQAVFLDISDSGNSQIRVNSYNRESISFSGTLVERDNNGKKAF
ncbi:DUF4251 domain-containing protein [Terrimonas ferruginea]|uniref:DUF4251 domain-containing protein n=1 Tax=Terrimonas ferruginea TaxID=249 RepID=UPI00048F501B|nr:DUF4251 domain-containing protein [Terrimonas ferruginea]